MNVGGLEASVNQPVFVEEIERGKNWSEHAASFIWSEGALREKLAEVFVGKFGDDVEAGGTVNDAATGIEDAEKSGMRKRCCSVPAFELDVGIGRILGDEFDGGVGRRFGVARRFD